MKSASNPRNLLFFTNGSIGDFLMVLFFSEIVQSQDKMMRVHILTPRNKKMFAELASEYSVTIHESNLKSISGIIGSFSLFRYVFSKNIVVTPSTSGHVPWHVKLLARKLSFFPGSLLVGFNDQAFFNSFLYDRLYQFDESILYPDSMIALARELGFVAAGGAVPKLKYKKDESFFATYGLTESSYVVLHPCGSSLKRTLLPEEIKYIIDSLRDKNPGIKIVFTGSESDRVYIEQFLQFPPQNILNLAGKLSMNTLVSVLDASRFFIGVDTGITHVASMLGKKSFVISHESSVFYWLPYYNKNARILYDIRNCPHGVHEGIEHLKQCYSEAENYLGHVSLDVIKKAFDGGSDRNGEKT